MNVRLILVIVSDHAFNLIQCQLVQIAAVRRVQRHTGLTHHV